MKKSVTLHQVRSSRGFRVAGVLIAGLMMTLAPFASAGTIGISGGQLIVGTEPGDGAQSIAASITGTDLRISGIDFDLVTQGCTAVGSSSFDCPLSGFDELVVLGGSGDDAISLGAIAAPPFAITILGGPGNDVLVGSGGDDTIFGGPGDDILIGGPGVDCLLPGAGNNVVIQAARTGCPTGPDPVITPLPRAEVPEPGGLLLMATGLGALAITTRKLRPGRC